MGTTSQSLILAPCMHMGGNDACVCAHLGERCEGYSLKVESTNESSLPSCLATSPLHGCLLFIEPLFLALYNLGPLPFEELTGGRWKQMKTSTVFVISKQNSLTVMALQI